MDLINKYFEYTKETEAPRIYHRWCVLSAVGALLGRHYYMQHGTNRIFPNIYVMLIGDVGSRKSSTIKLVKKFLISAGYDTFAANKTRKEKFLLDLEGVDEGLLLDKDKMNGKPVYDAMLAKNLWGDDATSKEPKEVFIVADEFNEFMPPGDIEFCSLLGDLWDWDEEKRPYEYRLKNSKSVSIYQPTVSILGGNTPENFMRAFPPEILGQGFLSRLIIVHGEVTGKKYAFPRTPAEDEREYLVQQFTKLRGHYRGAATIEPAAFTTLVSIYENYKPLDDTRFKGYSQRRFTQLLKLCLIYSVLRDSIIDCETVLEASTTLSAVESHMSTALGEFGKSKNSDVAHKILDVLAAANKPLAPKALWSHVHKDLERPTQLAEMLQNLVLAGKVQHIDKKGYLPLKQIPVKPEFVDYSLLTPEEQVGL